MAGIAPLPYRVNGVRLPGPAVRVAVRGYTIRLEPVCIVYCSLVFCSTLFDISVSGDAGCVVASVLWICWRLLNLFCYSLFTLFAVLGIVFPVAFV